MNVQPHNTVRGASTTDEGRISPHSPTTRHGRRKNCGVLFHSYLPSQSFTLGREFTYDEINLLLVAKRFSFDHKRYFVRDCIKDAITKLNGDQVLDEAVRLDHDTAGIPGTPDIANTIFGKISESAVFVADLTLCSESSSGKRSPNPNVLIELGYAFSEIGDSRVISVMNTAFGEPGQLPFDLSHKRWPIQYKLEELAFDKKSDDFKRLKNQVTSEIYNAICLVVAAIPQTAPPPYGPLSPPSFAYVENSILSSDPRADWEVISTDWDTTAISRKDVNLRLVVSSEDEGIQNADFKETWANCHPDQSATGYWCDIYYASTRVARNLLVSVDGARAMLPIPRQGGASGKVTEVLPFDHRLAQIFDTSGAWTATWCVPA